MKGLLFTYALTYGGALASLINPYIGLLVYICFSIMRPEALWFWTVPAGNYSRIVAIALLVGWAINGFGGWNFGKAKGATYALIGFLVWGIVSTLFAATYPELGWSFVETKSKIVLPFVVGITLIDSVSKLKQLAWVIVLSQGYVAYDLNNSYYSGYNRVLDVGFGGTDSNGIAISMVTTAGFAFFLGNADRVWWRKLLAFAAAGLMTHVVLFSFSRGGMLALGVTGLVSFILMPKQPKHYALFALAVVIGLRMAGPQVIEEFQTTFADEETRDESSESRLIMWGVCCEMIISNPVFGVGPDHFPPMQRFYGSPYLSKAAHTTWLQMGAELGLVGVGCLAAFYFLCVRQVWPLRRPQPGLDPWLSEAARMVLVALAGFVVSSQFVTVEGLEVPYYVNLLGAGAVKLASLPSYAGQTPTVSNSFDYYRSTLPPIGAS